MSFNAVKDFVPASTIKGAAVGALAGGGGLGALAGGYLGRQKEKEVQAAKGAAADIEGYAAGTVDDYAASLNSVAGGGSLSQLRTRRQSAGTIENPAAVQPKIDQLTNLFYSRKSQIQQRSLMPGLRASTTGRALA